MKIKQILVIAMTILLSFSACSTTSKTKTEYKEVVILATSDLHGNVLGFSYEDGKETTNNGMARLYSTIKSERESNPNLLLIDSGDDIQGTIMTDDLANKETENEHPVIAAMNYIGYDAMIPGNHEFNWGIEKMKAILGQAEFPVIASNIKDTEGNLITGKGSVIIEKNGVKIAIVGAANPNIPIWDGGKEGISDYTYESAAYGVKEEIAKLPEDTDVIIVSAHMGTYAEFDEENGSDSGLFILDVNPEVDVLLLAHNHTTINQYYNEKPVLAVRNGGREIAKVTLILDSVNNIVDTKTEIIPMDEVEPSQEIRDIESVKNYHYRAVTYVSGVDDNGVNQPPLGYTTAIFQPENEIRGIPEGKLRDTAVVDLINRIQLEASGADVSAAALFKDTSNLPEGKINYGNIFDIYKFDNTLYRVQITGKELKKYMEWSASCYNQWKEGDINISFNPDKPGYLYDMFAGVDYEIDLSKEAGERIVNVTYKGEELKDDEVLTLAVNNYRYSSALKAQNIVANKKEWESSLSIRDMIVEYFASNSPVSPTVDNNWKITGVDLREGDERREEIISLINDGKLDVPYNESYNLKDYDALIKKANR